MQLVSPHSVLRRLPPQLDRKQALFLDGLRHAAEIASLAYTRLMGTLTEIAVCEGDGTQPHITRAYLDAWAFVDSVDRFRTLLFLLPGATPVPGEPTFAELSQAIRDLRNVSDHLAQRADYVIAHKGTALGVLSWFTFLDPAKMSGVICTICPGSLGKVTGAISNPSGKEIEFPTGAIQLAAGDRVASLSDVIPAMEVRIQRLERAISDALSSIGATESAGADLVLKLHVEFQRN